MIAPLQKTTVAPTSIDYPESDGKLMAETDLHRDVIVRIIQLLQSFLADTLAYVSGNLLIYYEEGNPQRSVAPDCFVVKGAEQRHRRIYKVWEEGKAPDVVFEVTSNRTKREDLGLKKKLYARLGVQEYFPYDPTADYLQPPLQGFWLDNEAYRPLPPGADGSLLSRELGLRLVDASGTLQLYDLAGGQRLLTAEERAEAAEAEVDRLRAELEQLRGRPE
jgi:Uma2 family endonuclease